MKIPWILEETLNEASEIGVHYAEMFLGCSPVEGLIYEPLFHVKVLSVRI